MAGRRGRARWWPPGSRCTPRCSTSPAPSATGWSGTSSPTWPSGERDDRAPAWLSEGIAEWVSVQPLAPELRRLPQEALARGRGRGAAAARRRHLQRRRLLGPLRRRAGGRASTSWPAFGERRACGGCWRSWTDPDADQDVVLESLVGLTARMLARRGAKMMINEYDPGLPRPGARRRRRPATPTDEPTRAAGLPFPRELRTPSRPHRRRGARPRRCRVADDGAGARRLPRRRQLRGDRLPAPRRRRAPRQRRLGGRHLRRRPAPRLPRPAAADVVRARPLRGLRRPAAGRPAAARRRQARRTSCCTGRSPTTAGRRSRARCARSSSGSA